MSEDIRIDLLQHAINKSELDGPTKDALADDLKYAHDINGTDDAALKGIKRILISGARRELLAHERLNSAISEHKKGCRFGGAMKMLTAVGSVGAICLTLLRLAGKI